MKLKNLFKLSFLPICAASVAPMLTSCSVTKETNKENDVIISTEYIHNFKSFFTNLNEITEKTLGKEFIEENIINDITANYDVWVPSVESKTYYDFDPVCVFQMFLVSHKDFFIPVIDEICSSKALNVFVSQENIQWFHDEMMDIFNDQSYTQLKVFFTNHMLNLERVFEATLYRLMSKEQAWSLIWNVYADTYYTGLAFNHANGEHISDTKITLTQTPKYEKYDYSNIKSGDIMFSSTGFFDMTGHIGIVDGWYKDTNGIDYLRVIEANQFGVSYGLIDDTRMDSDKMDILRVKNNDGSDVSETIRNNVVQKCFEQLNKDYYLPLFPKTDYKSDASSWYCSELAWYAYMTQGIDINLYSEKYLVDLPGILPWEIYYSKNTYSILSYLQ